MLLFGNSTNYWVQSDNTTDISRGSKTRFQIETSSCSLKFDPSRSAIIIHNMQNYFLSKKLHADKEYRKLYEPVRKSIIQARRIGMGVVWLNWGLRSDLGNISPSLLWAFHKQGIKFGDELPNHLGKILEKNSWSAEIVDELKDLVTDDDLWIYKNRMNGFHGTELQQILTNQGIQSLFFAGINTDQSVLATMLEADSLGYDCVLLSDCTATTSPEFAYQTVLYQIEQFGFLSNSREFSRGNECYNSIDAWLEDQIKE